MICLYSVIFVRCRTHSSVHYSWAFNKPQDIKTVIHESTGVQIVDLNILPNRICEQCFNILRSWYKFRSQTQRSHEILNEYLKELRAKLDSNSLPSTDLTIHIKGSKVNVLPAENVNQIEGFEVMVVKDKPEVVGFVLHCNRCSMSFTNQVDLEKHTEEHDRSRTLKSFKCEYCNKLFTFRRGLKNHVELHHKTQSFKCKVCDEVYATPKAYWSHKGRLCVSLELIEKSKVRAMDMTLKEIIAGGEKAIKETEITCAICRKYFKNYNGFVRHFPTHYDNLVCSICNRVYLKFGLLERHVRVHLTEKMYACPYCSRSFYARESLRGHILNHAKSDLIYRCYECQKDFFLVGEFKQHVKKHLKAAKDKKKARQCKKIDDLNVVDMENDDNIEIVNESDSNTLGKDDGENEMTIKIEQDEFVKEEILSDEDTPNRVVEYKLIKTEMEFPPIDLTDSTQQLKIVKFEKELESNYKMETGLQTEINNATTVKTNLGEKVKFEEPELNLSADEETDEESNDNLSFLSKSNDQVNENESKKHTKESKDQLDLWKVTCHVPGCQMEFPNFRSTVVHFLNDHLGDKSPFECAMCFEKFKNKTLIHAHIKKYYTFKCQVCLRVENSFPSLRKHIERIHFSNHYKCSICNKTFGAVSYLKAHEITHCDEKQFVCSICQKEFFSKNGLYLHLKSHKDIKELQCNICGRQLSSKGRLAKHYGTCILKKIKNN